MVISTFTLISNFSEMKGVKSVWYILFDAKLNSNLLLPFLPCDAIGKHGLCCHPVSICLLVSLFFMLVYCIHIAEDIVKLLSWPW